MKSKKLKVSIMNTKYPVISSSTRSLGWSTTMNNDWDIMWQDGSVSLTALARMKLSQKINHFPGMYEISRKNYLAKNLNRFREVFPEDFDFYPQTWILPQEISGLKSALLDKHTIIIKPDASSQGKGIVIVDKLQDLSNLNNTIAQKYVKNPLLIDGLKFDLRIYVLVAGCDPLRIYIHEEGLARFATETYSHPCAENINNKFMHLTNYAVNKLSEKFIQNNDSNCENSHKRSLSSVFKKLEAEGRDCAGLWDDICDLIIKSLCTAQPLLATTYSAAQSHDYFNGMCFEVLGYDILIDEDLKPWLLEVNFTPSFTTDSQLDLRIKSQLITDTLKLVSLSAKSKASFDKIFSQFSHRRSSGRKTKQEIAELKMVAQDIRDAHEDLNRGGFIKIYPAEDYFCYSKFLKHAQILWTGGFLEMIYMPRMKKGEEVKGKRRERSPVTPMKRKNSKCKGRISSKALNFGSTDVDEGHSRSKSYFLGNLEDLRV